MKYIYLNFTADNKTYKHSLVAKTEEELAELWEDDLEDHKDFNHEYQGFFVQNQIRFNQKTMIGINLSFPRYYLLMIKILKKATRTYLCLFKSYNV